MNVIEFDYLKKQFEKDCEAISSEKYNELYEYLYLFDEIDIWNEIQKECGYDDRIIHYNNKNKSDNEFDILHQIINPYYRIDEYGDIQYYNDNTVVNYISEVYEFDYDVLKYIFNPKNKIRESVIKDSQIVFSKNRESII